jgi:Tfp pilus assembly protein PilE
MKNTIQHTVLKQQYGMTFIGLVLIIAAIVFFAILGMKVAPPYMEYMSVKNAIKKAANSADLTSKKDVANAFDRSASVDNITVVKGADLTIENGVISTQYQVVVPIVANASVLLDFNATSAK